MCGAKAPRTAGAATRPPSCCVSRAIRITIADNDLTQSGDGFFLSGHRPLVRPSVGNLVLRNDATGAYHNAFESTFSWDNTFVDNHADSASYGFWLGYSSGTLVRGNTILGSRMAGIAIEHGSDNAISGNVIIGGKTGIWLFAPGETGESDDPSRGYHRGRQRAGESRPRHHPRADHPGPPARQSVRWGGRWAGGGRGRT